MGGTACLAGARIIRGNPGKGEKRNVQGRVARIATLTTSCGHGPRVLRVVLNHFVWGRHSLLYDKPDLGPGPVHCAGFFYGPATGSVPRFTPS